MGEIERQWSARVRGGNVVGPFSDGLREDAEGFARRFTDVVSRTVTYGPWQTDEERAAEAAQDADLLATIAAIVRGTERGNVVYEWPDGEAAMHRRSDWPSFVARNEAVRDYVARKAALEILEILGLITKESDG